MQPIKCKTCEGGSLIRRKKYRMSGAVVVIGYILLIPSILGILLSVLMFGSLQVAGSETMDTVRASVEESLREAGVPDDIIARVASGQDLTAADSSVLTAYQLATVAGAELGRAAGSAGAGLGVAVGAGIAVVIGVASLVGGLLGWLLVMRKRVLECDNCGAVLAAS